MNEDLEFAARAGLTQEQVQLSRDRGQQSVGRTNTAATQGAVGASTAAVSGAAAVSGTAGNPTTPASHTLLVELIVVERQVGQLQRQQEVVQSE
eukprot:5201349-Amphidinium_carterae.2